MIEARQHRKLIGLIVAAGFAVGVGAGFVLHWPGRGESQGASGGASSSEHASTQFASHSGRSLEAVHSAVAFVVANDYALRGSALLFEALENIAEDQVVPLLKELERLPARQRRKVQPLVFARLCRRYPAKATEWLHNTPNWSRIGYTGYTHGPSDPEETKELVRLWARYAPAQLLGEFSKSERNIDKFNLWDEVLKHFNPDDPDAQLQGVHKASSERLRNLTAGLKLNRALDEGADAGLAAAERLNIRSTDPRAWSRLLEQCASEAPQLVLEKLGRDVGTLKAGLWGNRGLNRIVAKAAATEPELTAKWVARIENPALRIPAAIKVASAWVEDDFDAAMAWAQANGVPLDLSVATDKRMSNYDFVVPADGSVLAAAALRSPQRVARWLETVADEAERERLAGYVANVTKSANTSGRSR